MSIKAEHLESAIHTRDHRRARMSAAAKTTPETPLNDEQKAALVGLLNLHCLFHCSDFNVLRKHQVNLAFLFTFMHLFI